MRHQSGSEARCIFPLLAVVTVLASCATASDEPRSSADQAASSPVTADMADATGIDGHLDLPPEARVSTGGGDPRPAAYWAVWNSCASDNRAEVAAANGGREAGFVLVDDVLADPGIQLGDHLLTSCEESVALLGGRTAAGDKTTDPIFALAALLLAAELNLNVGAETCPAIEEAVVGAHLVLSSANFDGVSGSPLDAEAGGALPTLIDLLSAYNTGDLCH